MGTADQENQQHSHDNNNKTMNKRCDVFIEKMKKLPCSMWRTFWKVGRDDPRRVIHAFKVGISLTLVSLLYLMEPLFKGIGQNAIWAVMTVVVVLEFSVGATLCKGLNRGLGTLLAGSLAFLIEIIATETGRVLSAVFIGAAVFVIGAAATYLRFVPYIKRNYDYGVLIFLLTFNLITVSSYRVDNILKVAHERFYTICIGVGICLLMTLMVFPIWSGEDLHKSTVCKLEGLARSIEACVNEYFTDEDPNNPKDNTLEDPIYIGYKSVLDSKSSDEALALYASWEPRHTRRCHKFPWQQYVKLGAALRHFGYTVVALHGCLQTEIQTPRGARTLFKDPCNRLAAEVSKSLMELADSIRTRRQCSPEILSDQLHQALQDLDAAFQSQPRLFLGPNAHHHHTMLAMAAERNGHNHSGKNLTTLPSVKRPIDQLKEAEKRVLRPTLSKITITSLEFSEALPFAAFASLLVEAVARLDLVILEAQELGDIANFAEFVPGDEVKITCERPSNVEKVTSFTDNLPSNAAE